MRTIILPGGETDLEQDFVNRRNDGAKETMFFVRKKHLRIIYTVDKLSESYLAASQELFDVNRFEKIRRALLADNLMSRKFWVRSEPVKEEDLLRIHTPAYLKKLRSSGYLAQALHLDYISPWDSDLLEYFMYQTGGTVQAADLAYSTRGIVANLGGGFHHAFPEQARGFCLLNDIAIAIQHLRVYHKNLRIMVVDLDFHQGDGVAVIFKDDQEVFTFSIHAENWREIASDTNFDLVLPPEIGDESYLNALSEELGPVAAKFQPEMVVYLAGADVHRDDPLGNFGLSDQGVLDRDIFVYQLAKKYEAPLVAVAGGGYGMTAWRLYYHFLKWILQKGK